MSIRDHSTVPRRPRRAPIRPRRAGAPGPPAAPYAAGTSTPASAPPPPPPNWRDEIVSLSGLNVIAGIWLIIAPWVLAYSSRDPRWNDVVFGIIVGLIALSRVSGAIYEEFLSWINALIGVWLFIAAFTIDHTGVASWNDFILGIIVFVLAVGSAEATAELLARRRGRGPTPA